MSYTPIPFQRLSASDVNPYHAALEHAFNTFGKGIHTAYMPQTIEADIFSKKFAPLAQIASNPLAMQMMGDRGVGVMRMISDLLHQQGSSGLGGITQSAMSSPKQTSNASTYSATSSNDNSGYSYDANGNNVTPDSTFAQQSSNKHDPSFPQKGLGVGAGFVAKALAPGEERPHTPNTVYEDKTTGKTYTDPGTNAIAQSTGAIQAIKRTIPQLDKIVKESKEFTAPGADFGRLMSWLGNQASLKFPGGVITPETEKAIGIDPTKISRYTEWQNHMKTAAKDLMSAYPALAESDQSLNVVMGILQPQPGETTGYKDRVLNAVKALNDRQLQMQQQMQPLEVTGSVNTTQPASNTRSNVAQNFISHIPNMKNDNEFTAAFNTLNTETKREVLKLLKEQG